MRNFFIRIGSLQGARLREPSPPKTSVGVEIQRPYQAGGGLVGALLVGAFSPSRPHPLAPSPRSGEGELEKQDKLGAVPPLQLCWRGGQGVRSRRADPSAAQNRLYAVSDRAPIFYSTAPVWLVRDIPAAVSSGLSSSPWLPRDSHMRRTCPSGSWRRKPVRRSP